MQTRSLSYGLNLQVAKLGIDVKGGGGSLNVTVLGVNMYIGAGEDGFLFGSSYTHNGQVIGDDWSINPSDAMKNFSNMLHNVFTPSSSPMTGAPGVIINSIKYSY